MGVLSCWQECKGMSSLFVGMFLYWTATSMAAPPLIDITMSALCPMQQECSEAIFITGLQQVVSGVGTMFVTPIIGALSDQYGRKILLIIPMAFAVVPLGVLAYSRSQQFVYAYFVLKAISDMMSEGGLQCITMAYVADRTNETSRTQVLGVLMGIISLAYVCGVIIARILPSEAIFLMATAIAVSAALFMTMFLDEPRIKTYKLPESQPLHAGSLSNWHKPKKFLRMSSMQDTIQLFKRSLILAQIVVITFFSNLAESGLQGSLLFYLKARFQFGKNQYANLMLIVGGSNVALQWLVLPFMMQYVSEHKLVRIGLFSSSVHYFLYGIAWSAWVPYASAFQGILSGFTPPCLGSIISKEAGIDEQGKVHGLMSGVRSFARVISPLIMSPLTALFLSTTPPFKCPGFSMILAASMMMIAVIQACMMRPSHSEISIKSSSYVQVPTCEGHATTLCSQCSL